MKLFGIYPNPLHQAYSHYLWNKVVLGMEFECNIENVLANYEVSRGVLVCFIYWKEIE
jgi:hypothetical protein